MLNNLLKNKYFMIVPMAAALLVTGCNDESTPVVPEADAIDLAETKDLFSAPVQANPLTSDPNAVVVRVNGEDITRGEILELMKAPLQQLAMQQQSGRIQPQQIPQIQAQMYQQFKNDLITKKLIDAAVAAANIVIPDAEIATTIEEIKARIPEGQTLEAFLTTQGTTIDELKKNIAADMATRKYLETETAKVEGATEADAKEYYTANLERFKKPETVAASHILIKFEGTETDAEKAEMKAKLEQIRADIVAGNTTFEGAAKEHSGCPSGTQGGSLGTFGKGQMVPQFEVAAFSQEINEVGDVIETDFGYHIIKVSEHQEEGVVSFEEAKEQLMDGLGAQKKQQTVIQGLRDSATIEELAM